MANRFGSVSGALTSAVKAKMAAFHEVKVPLKPAAQAPSSDRTLLDSHRGNQQEQ